MAKRKPKITELEHCTSIREYEASVIWKRKSAELLDDKECKCEICGRSRWKWQVRNKKWKRVLRFSVHHRHYRTVPNESREDFSVLCFTCHDGLHNILRLEDWAGPWKEIAAIARKWFFYEGNKGFVPW